MTRKAVWLCVMASAFIAPVAKAQITLDPHALDMLGTNQQTDTKPAYHLESPKIVAPKRPTVAAPAKVTMPQAPTPMPQIPPAVQVPVRAKGAPPPIPINSQAIGRVLPLAHGVRITFGTDQSVLNPATVAAIRAFADRQRDNKDQEIAVDAFAAGSPEDPSTPRRLSLQRALAVRSVLLDAGIESPRIIVRAMGAASGPGWADRVDVATADVERSK